MSLAEVDERLGLGDEFVGGRRLEGHHLDADALVTQVLAESGEVDVAGTENERVDVVRQRDGV